MPVIETLKRPDNSFQPAEVQMTPGLGRNSVLDKTGFNLSKEAGRFFENYNQNLRVGKTPGEALAVTARETEKNIRTFIVEYIQAGAVLPNPSRIGQVNGVNRMVGDNGVPVVDGTTEEERKGSARLAVMLVDDVVSVLEPGQVVVINSPKGWSGFFSADSRPIKFKNSQTMVHWIDEAGRLKNITIVNDLEQDKSKQLSIDLGVDQADLSGQTEEDRVTAIVAHPALLFFPQFNVSPAEYVLDRILSIRGNSPFRLEQEDGTVETRSVEDIKKQIQNPDQLLKFNEDCEDHLLILKQFILAKVDSLGSPDTRIEIVRAIERTILNITLDYMDKMPAQPKQKQAAAPQRDGNAIWISGHNWTGFTRPVDYGQADALQWQKSDRYDKAAAFLRTRAGCNGGGGGSVLQQVSVFGAGMVMISMIGAGAGMDFMESDSKGPLWFPCPACGKPNKRPKEGYVESCQNSGCSNPEAVRC